MGQRRNWTNDEKEYLEEKWGFVSIDSICKHLNRSKNGIMCMKQRLGLGRFLDSGDYVTFNQFMKTIGYSGSGYMLTSWVKNRDFPMRTKKVGKNSFYVVYIEEFWEWAEKNKDLLDFSKFEKHTLGKEPEWVDAKRKHDFEISRRYKKSPWTAADDGKLIYMIKQFKYSYPELSKELRRTSGAIKKRLKYLNIKERPVPADNHIKWTDDEIDIVDEMIRNGYGYEMISEEIGKSAKAIRGKVYRMYGSENLDKVREKMKRR